MAPSHSHSSTCGCDPSEHQQVEGTQDSLYSKIDRDRIVVLNSIGVGKSIFLPWDERNQETVYLESDSDEQLIIQVPFTGAIKCKPDVSSTHICRDSS